MNLWLSAGALVMSIGWLLPIHYMPWTTFHNDAWVAGVLLLLCFASLIKIRVQQPWSRFAVFIAVLSLVPLCQLVAGQVRLSGTAWISTLYTLGLLLAVLTGARWQSCRGSDLADALFLSVGAGAVVSVGLQLCQWLGVTTGCLCSLELVLPAASNSRISANLAQPNQLATLLLLGILAFAWAWVRQTISSSLAVAAAIFLLVGLALTESRTAVLSLSLMLLCMWCWRSLWPSRLTVHVVGLLYLAFIAMFALQGFLTQWLLLEHSSSVLTRTQGDTRWDMWLMLGRAAFYRPWLGYGWNQTVLAQVITTSTLANGSTTRELPFFYAHNLFMDLVLWMGVPLGLLSSAAVVSWLGRVVRYVKNSQDGLLVLGVISIGVHAMLEFPLYYAYFLLPLGLIVGMLDVRTHHRPALVTGLRPVVGLWLICSVLFIAVVRDYFAVEQSYTELRLEVARIASKTPRQQANVLLLTQLRDIIELARFEAVPDMSQEKIDWVTNVTLANPAPPYLLKLATVLALNGQVLQARDWLGRTCNLYPGNPCVDNQSEWKKLQTKFPQLANVDWPAMSGTTSIQTR